MKLAYTIFIPILLLTSCIDKNQATIKWINDLSESYFKGEIEASEWISTTEMLRRDLVRSGYFEYREYTLEDIRYSDKLTWQTLQDELLSSIREDEYGGAGFSIGPLHGRHPDNINSPMVIELYDKPESIVRYDSIIYNSIARTMLDEISEESRYRSVHISFLSGIQNAETNIRAGEVFIWRVISSRDDADSVVFHTNKHIIDLYIDSDDTTPLSLQLDLKKGRYIGIKRVNKELIVEQADEPFSMSKK